MAVTARTGAGPLDGDIALPGGLYQAGKGRALAENTRPSRSRGGRPRRTLDLAELSDWVDRLCQIDGAQRLAEYRENAEHVADAVGAPKDAVRKLAQLIGAALGTQRVQTASKALTARQASLPYDQDRIRLFDRLITGLRQSAPQNRSADDPCDPRYTFLPFFEAYFYNFIEGTEFELDEAIEVVYDNKQIPGRGSDSHDLLGTYKVVSGKEEMSTLASSRTSSFSCCDPGTPPSWEGDRTSGLGSSRKCPIASVIRCSCCLGWFLGLWASAGSGSWN
jgi:hypothetical protein